MIVVSATEPRQLAAIGTLFREYASMLGGDDHLADLARELAALPGEYGPPRGALLIAEWSGEAAGCVAIRPLDSEHGEMRRLYVRHPYRGRGVGRALARAAVGHARGAGYTALRLHVATWMGEAVTLYRALGFRDVPPYRVVTLAAPRFMELSLR